MRFKKYPNLVIFVSLVTLVSLIHYILLKPVLLTGFETDDWGALLYLKSHTPNVLSQIFNLWTKVGIHHTGQYLYIGTLFNIFGFNYPIYNFVNIIFKTVATLSTFPVVFFIFKKRSLAFLTTIIYAMSYSSTGALTYVLQGVYYLGITFINIFFIFYYFAVTKNSKLFLFLASLSLSIGYVLATGRIYPIFVVIFIIEFFLVFRNGIKNTLGKSIIRLVSLYVPIIILILVGQNNYSYLGSPSSTFQDLINGNWHLLLIPFSGLGYLFSPGDHGKSIVYLNIQNFGDYFYFLIEKYFEKYFLVLTTFSIILALILTKNIFKFFWLILVINFVISLIVFLIANSYTYVPQSLLAGYDRYIFWEQQYHTLLGIYTLTVGIYCLWRWMKTKTEENRLLLAAFVGPFFAFIFLLGTWVILGGGMNLYGGVNRYFPFASLGSSLFMAAILSLVLEKAAEKGIVIRRIVQIFIFIVFLFSFYISTKEIDISFRENNVRNSYLHKQVQENFISQLQIEKIRDKTVFLFYFDMPTGKDREYFERAFDFYNFRSWLYLRLGITNNTKSKCIGVIVDEVKLKEAIRVKQGEKGFSIKNTSGPYNSSGCVQPSDSTRLPENVIYKIQDFYAFRVEGDRFIDITDEVLEKFQLK